MSDSQNFDVSGLLFKKALTITYGAMIPADLRLLNEAFDSDDSRFLRTTENTQANWSISGGVLTLTSPSGSSYSSIIREGDDLTVPQCAVQAHFKLISAPGPSYNVVGVGIAKDSSNFIMAGLDKVAGVARVQVKINGSNTFDASISFSIPTEFDLAFTLVGNSVCVWVHNGTSWSYATGYNISSYIDLTTADLTAWKPAFMMASGGGSVTWTVDDFQYGRYGSFGVRDQTLVTYEDGTPFIIDGVAYFLATCNDARGVGYCGVFSLDLSDFSLTQTGVLLFDRSDTVKLDVAGHLVSRDDGSWTITISSWGNGFGNDISVYCGHTQDNLLSGTHLVSSLNKLSLPHQTSGKAAYDPFLYHANGTWVLAYTVCDNLDFTGSPFWSALASSGDLSDWQSAGSDSTTPYEGTKVVKYGSSYFVTAGTSTKARIYTDSMTFLGYVKAGFSGGTVTQPHAMVFRHDHDFVLVTFNGVKPQTVTANFTWGQMEVFTARSVLDSHGDPLISDPAFEHVTCLLHCDGSDNGTQCVDSSPSPKSYTVSGGAVTKTGVKKFGTSSFYFDGSGDYLSSASNAAFDLGSADFTIEFWVYFLNGGHGGSYSRILQIGPNSTTGGLWIVSNASDSPAKLLVQGYRSGSYFNLIGAGATLANNTWHHVALVKRAGVYELFVNGTSYNTSTPSPSYTHVQGALYVGSNNSGSESFYGYLDDVRITKGVPRYIESFNVPSAAFPDSYTLYVVNASGEATCDSIELSVSGYLSVDSLVAAGALETCIVTVPVVMQVEDVTGSGIVEAIDLVAIYLSAGVITSTSTLPDVSVALAGDTLFPYVKLLLHCNGQDTSTIITDECGKSVIAQGNSQLVTGTKKFGSASCYLDGNTSYLSIPYHTDFNFGGGDFTVELWAWYSPAPGETHLWLFDSRNSSGSIGVLIGLNAYTGRIYAAINGWISPDHATPLPTNEWVHIALERSSGNVTLYQNGVAGGYGSGINAIVSTNNGLRLGASQINNSFTWRGYIDEVRVTKGVARYGQAFSVPTEAFPDFYELRFSLVEDISAHGTIDVCEVEVDTTKYLWSADVASSGSVDSVIASNDNSYLTSDSVVSRGSCSDTTLHISRLLILPSATHPVGRGSITVVAYNVIPLTALDARGGGSIQVRAVVKAQTLQIADAVASGIVDTVFYPGVMRPAELRARGALAAVAADIATNVAILKAPVKFVVVQEGAAPQRVSLQLGLYIGPGGELSVPVEYVIRDQQEGVLAVPVRFRVYQVAEASLGITYRIAAFGQPTAPVEFIINDIYYGTLSRRVEFRVFYAPVGSAGQIKATVRFCVYSDNHLFFT